MLAVGDGETYLMQAGRPFEHVFIPLFSQPPCLGDLILQLYGAALDAMACSVSTR